MLTYNHHEVWLHQLMYAGAETRTGHMIIADLLWLQSDKGKFLVTLYLKQASVMHYEHALYNTL